MSSAKNSTCYRYIDRDFFKFFLSGGHIIYDIIFLFFLYMNWNLPNKTKQDLIHSIENVCAR